LLDPTSPDGLPLLKRATEDGVTFVLTPATHASPAPAAPKLPASRLPLRAPGPGEQYRFHVDMGKCIGCKCCVVACNEQNGNPAAINWRRVTEIEGGWYPRAERSYLSTGCHHCLEPTCLQGCPVDAYTKDAGTGIVLHSADACIGCQYCTWNCSYGVPQYNPERGVVGKCDMCHTRLGLGQSPACVSACPTGAIQIEIVNVKSWRAAAAAATPGTGLPSGDQSISSTRITPPANVAPNAKPVDLVQLKPSEPHWALVVMTVFTQLSVGAFATIFVLHVSGAFTHLGAAALTSLAVAAWPWPRPRCTWAGRSTPIARSRCGAAVAQQGSPAVLGFSRPPAYAIGRGSIAGGAAGALTLLFGFVASRRRVHLPRALAAGVEHAAHTDPVQPTPLTSGRSSSVQP
jgi:Fe-S-cluster-containing dehydrogenase component